MKLLFDHNLSPRLVTRLANTFPHSAHVYALGLDMALDEAVWEYARLHDYTIVTRDSDFNDISVMRGFPPRVIWIRRGNCSSGEIELLLRSLYDDIATFGADTSVGVLALF